MPDTALPRSPALLDAAGAAALVASYAAVSKGAQLKDIGRIDVHMGRFIALSPLCLIATADASGRQDVTPRGDPPGSFKVLDGALYTALHRMEERAWVESEWGTSDKKKRAKFYRLTAAGRRALRAETESWNDYVAAVARVMTATLESA